MLFYCETEHLCLYYVAVDLRISDSQMITDVIGELKY